MKICSKGLQDGMADASESSGGPSSKKARTAKMVSNRFSFVFKKKVWMISYEDRRS